MLGACWGHAGMRLLCAAGWPRLAGSTRCLPIAPQSLTCARQLAKGHKVEDVYAPRDGPPAGAKVTKWRKWKDPRFQPVAPSLCDFSREVRHAA
jgi:hypothetical protein